MAKRSRQRAMPSTPSQRASHDNSAHDAPAGPAPAHNALSAADSPERAVGTAPGTPAKRREPEYLVHGTKCVNGHAPGEELISAGIGRVPTRRATRIGIALVLWCGLGLSFIVDIQWLLFGFQALLLWLAFSAVVQRRAGHRGRCWRTRAWRHAWGGLVPTPKDPTRPARAA